MKENDNGSFSSTCSPNFGFSRRRCVASYIALLDIYWPYLHNEKHDLQEREVWSLLSIY